MAEMKVTDSIRYIGADDTTIDLFESQYPVPKGVSYNSYVILDEKIAVMDTVDPRATDEWLENLKRELGERTPDYLVVSHMEPDHGGSIQVLANKYPEMKIVGNAKTFNMISQNFVLENLDSRKVVVKEGDSLNLGSHTLQFYMAPMVHWPEVMVTYETSEKVLFSADGFGTFGAISENEEWIAEARRYYINIVGKYGAPVQTLLKKASGLDIAMICPLHGPVLKENLGYYLEKYDIWSSYRPEEKGIVIACASIHGHTAEAARRLEEILKAKGQKVVYIDLCRTHVSNAVEAAFQYDRMVLAASSYDAGVFLPMEDFLHHLKAKTYQNRTVALMENGSWAPSAIKTMKSILEGMKNIKICEKTVTIKSSMNEDTVSAMEAMAEELCQE